MRCSKCLRLMIRRTTRPERPRCRGRTAVETGTLKLGTAETIVTLSQDEQWEVVVAGSYAIKERKPRRSGRKRSLSVSGSLPDVTASLGWIHSKSLFGEQYALTISQMSAVSESTVSVACLGPEGSFSHEFALSRFPKAKMVCVDGGFDEVVARLKSGECTHGVLPFLNSNGVEVRPAQAAIGKERTWINVVGCFPHLVSHNVVVTEKFQSLRRVVSKEQVFPQCSTWLGQWGDLQTVNASSTSAALRDLLAAPLEEQRVTGAICNALAHSLYGGIIKYPRIENPKNTTLFLVVDATKPRLHSENILVCLTCPTETCYKSALKDFAAAGFPTKFNSLKGEFTEEIPCFLQFHNSGSPEELTRLLEAPHRTLIGGFPTVSSLSACVGAFFEDSLDGGDGEL